MARKNKRMKTEYHKGLGFDPRKYTTPAPRLYAYTTAPDRIPQRGDIWFANLGSHDNTSVQGGTRPVIIISNNVGNSHSDTVNVVPMTRHLKKPELPCHMKLYPDSITDTHQLLDTSMVLAEQIATISKYALRNYVGHISDADVMQRIDAAVAAQLGLKERSVKCL